MTTENSVGNAGPGWRQAQSYWISNNYTDINKYSKMHSFASTIYTTHLQFNQRGGLDPQSFLLKYHVKGAVIHMCVRG